MRLIDADKLLQDIERYHLSDGKFQHWVEVQPTIEPKPQWIPCSEKLPGLGMRVLISDGEKVNVAQLGKWPRTGYIWEFGIYGNDLKDWPYWMPAPEPPRDDTE